MECASCGRGNRADARFCDGCGNPLAAPAPPEERKQVTVLFADVVGSMALAERLDPEELRTVMERFFELLSAGVRRYDGTVDKFTGDGIMALFGAPVAYEDHALRACHAAWQLQRDVTAAGLGLDVRMGLNSGEVVAGDIGEYTAVGHTVGLAQRMESLAAPGSTYLTARTAALVEGLVELRDLGEMAVRGASAPLGVLELTGVAGGGSRFDRARGRGLSRLVGRSDELERLEAALARARAGAGCVVGVVAEGGVGKSRLCHELAERARARAIPVYRAAAASHTRRVSFGVALDLLREYFGIAGLDPGAARPVVARGLDDAAGADLPLLLDFLGIGDPSLPVERMDPEARSRRLLDVVRRIVEAQSHGTPGVTFIEDLHWLDDASGLLLEALVEAVAGTRSLLVVNFRPEYAAGWMESEHYESLALAPLDAAAADALLGELLGPHPSLDGLAEALRERTGGNPFFIEEVVRALAEEGVLVGTRGAFSLGRPLDTVSVPPTVQAVLAERIDRLDACDKAVLQTAAVMGREFDDRVLARIVDGELAPALARLVAGAFLSRGDASHAFRHPLTQEVAYRTQLAERRRSMHARVAEALIELHADALDERATLIAHHWEAAGAVLDAARWHARGAAWSGTTDPTAAAEHWRRVRELTDGLPEEPEAQGLGLLARLWALQLGWRMGLDSDDTRRLFEEGRALAEAAGSHDALAMLITTMAAHHGLAGDIETSDRLVAETVELVPSLSPATRLALEQYVGYMRFLRGEYDRERLDAYVMLATEYRDVVVPAVAYPLSQAYFQRSLARVAVGDLEGARKDSTAAIAAAQSVGDLEAECWAILPEVWALVCTGEDATQLARMLLASADRIGSTFSRVYGHVWLGVALGDAGEHAEALEHLERGMALARERRTGLESYGRMLGQRGRVRLQAGDVDGALRDGLDGVAYARARGLQALDPEVTAVRALAAARRLDEAAALLAEAETEIKRLGAHAWAPEVRLCRADIARARGDAEGEVTALREAAAWFDRTGAPGRAATVRERLGELGGPGEQLGVSARGA